MEMKKKKNPEPPKKTYTDKDSAEAVGIVARMKKDAKKFKAGDVRINERIGLKMNERMDSLTKNPYFPTMMKRDMEKAPSKEKVMKSTKPASTKSMAKPMAKKKGR